MSKSCSLCGSVYGEPWKSLTVSYNERECEDCKRSVCVDCWAPFDRICKDCDAKLEAAEELVVRKAQALDALAAGVPMATHVPDSGWTFRHADPTKVGDSRKRALSFWLHEQQLAGTHWPTLEDAVLAARDAADGGEHGE